MDCSAQLPDSKGEYSIEAQREMEANLYSLRVLICELLRENHELRSTLTTERASK